MTILPLLFQRASRIILTASVVFGCTAAQVTIKEKIEISPRLPGVQSSGTMFSPNLPYLRFVYYWRSSASGKITVTGSCGNVVSAEAPGQGRTIPAGVEVIVQPALPGEYIIEVGTNPPDAPDLCGEGYLVFDETGAVLAFGDSGPYACRMSPPSPFYWSVITGFDLRVIMSAIDPGAKNYFDADGDYNSCTDPPFSFSSPATFAVVDGKDYGQLYEIVIIGGGDDEHLSEISYEPRGYLVELGYLHEIYRYVYIADGIEPSGSGAEVAVELRSEERASRKTFLVKGGFTILLGESKYYYAVVDENGKLVIKDDGDPAHPPGNRLQDVVFSVEKAEGDKLGVYWEKKYPLWSGGTFAGVTDLPSGAIRLVGRYWELGKTYKAKSTAAAGGRTGWIEIEVKKPGKLGSTNAKSKDVFDSEINIDDTCITYGGRYGIPPQLIKGQMKTEAFPWDFGGTVGPGFAPSYRYEPYTVQFWPKVQAMRTNPFYVSDDRVNDPPIPSHANVKPADYPYPNKTVWDMIYDHSQLVNNVPDDLHRMFGVRRNDNSMNFSPYDDIQAMYDEMLDYYLTLQGLEYAVAVDSSNNAMIEFLRDRWNGGGKNIKAQTRIAASYGLLQALYTTALARGYRRDRMHLPEDLNVTSTVTSLSMDYQKELLVGKLGGSAESGNDWLEGYEKGFYLLIYPEWNKKESYSKDVFRNSRNYLPKR